MSIESRIQAAELHSDEYKSLLAIRREQSEGRLIECLDDGFVCLVDSMGDDAAIVAAARVSYGAGTRKVSDDRNLIRYLMRHKHTTPFEMVEFKFHVRCPIDVFRQWIRHRTASTNEYSTRYSEAIDSMSKATDWRLQSASNKQGSSGTVGEEWPEGYTVTPDKENPWKWGVDYPNGVWLTDERDQPPTPAEFLSNQEKGLHRILRLHYEDRLKFGVAREQARKDLPLSSYTEAYWKIDAHNLFNFLRLRMDSHAQLEIRTFAKAMYKLIKPIVPAACEAFEDYTLNAVTLSGPEIKVLYSLITGNVIEGKVMTERERQEFAAKCSRLGVSNG